MNPHEEQVRELLAAAERDRHTFDILRRDATAPLETTLFHAQQAIEKGLKAALVAKGVVFPRIHDLLELHALAERHHLTLPVSRDLMARLAPYAVEFRYLGVIAPEVTREEAQAAVGDLLAWIKREVA